MKENIEEAIDRLEYVNRAYDCNNYYSRYDLDCIQILLSDYKRVLKENEEYSKQLDLDYVDNNYIPVSLVKEKIEGLKNKSGGNVFHIQQTINAEIRLLQELLEKRK